MAQINLEPLDPADIEQTNFGPDAKRWLTNVVDIINAAFTTFSNALNSLFATGLATVGGTGAGPYTVTVSGLTAAYYVTAGIVSSTNQVNITNVTPGSGSFAITFSADPGSGAIIVYQAYTAQP